MFLEDYAVPPRSLGQLGRLAEGLGVAALLRGRELDAVKVLDPRERIGEGGLPGNAPRGEPMAEENTRRVFSSRNSDESPANRGISIARTPFARYRAIRAIRSSACLSRYRAPENAAEYTDCSHPRLLGVASQVIVARRSVSPSPADRKVLRGISLKVP